MTENIAEPLLKWYDKNKRILPWRDKNNAYYTWVSEIMEQRTKTGRDLPALPSLTLLFPVKEKSFFLVHFS